MKSDKTKAHLRNTRLHLAALLTTQRGSSLARTEVALRSENLQDTLICSGCGCRVTAAYAKTADYCPSCKLKIERMIVFKHDLINNKKIGQKRLETFLTDYSSIVDMPYPLHGEHNPVVVRNAIESMIAATKLHDAAFAADKALKMYNDACDILNELMEVCNIEL